MKAPHHLLSTFIVLALSFTYAKAISPDWRMELNYGADITSNNVGGSNSCDTTVYVDMDLCAGSPLTINNQTVYSSGLYTDSLVSAGGCDSIVVYNVLFKPHYFYYTQDSICNGDSMLLGHEWRKSPGLYFDTLTSTFGCDSVMGVYLSYKDSTQVHQTIYKCVDDSVLVRGEWFSNPGLYYDTVYSTTVCDSFFVTKIINYPTPSVQAVASHSMICAGDSVTLQAIGNGTMIWNTGDTGTFTLAPQASMDYFVTIEDASGCVNYDSTSVFVIPLPQLSVSAPISLCVGDTVSLSAIGTGTISWSSGHSSPMQVSPQQDTFYVAQAINGFGCEVKDSVEVTVFANPTLSFSIPDSICAGDSILLSGISNASVNWNVGPGNNFYTKPQTSQTFVVTAQSVQGCVTKDSAEVSVLALPSLVINPVPPICEGDAAILYANTNGQLNWNVGVGNNIQLYPQTTSEYFVTSTGTNGCQSKDSIEVIVHSNPVIFTASTPTICDGDSVQLNAISNGVVNWNVGVGSSVMVSPATTTTYYATATNAFGCITEDSSTVVVNPNPTLSIAGTAPICMGDSIDLIANSNANIQWNTGTGSVIRVSPQQNTMYYVTATDNSGCIRLDSVEVTVWNLPGLNIAPVNPICLGESATIQANSNESLVWNTGATNSSIAVSPSVNTTYSVIATDANGCVNSDSIHLTVWPKPTLNVNASDTICEGDSVLLSATSNAASVWDVGGNPVYASPTSSTHYFVTATNNYGCTTMDSTLIVVHVKPQLSVNSVAPICVGQSVVLHANATSATSVSWNAGVGNTVVINPSNSGVYKATATSIHGCETSDSVWVTVHPLPTLNINNVTPVCYGQPVTLSAISNGNVTWNLGAGNPTQVTLGNSTYGTATATNVHGCSQTDSVYVQILPKPWLIVQPSQNEICIGDSVDISVFGNAPVIWNHGVTGNIVVTPQQTQTYKAIVQNNQGCSDSTEVTIKVHDIPTLNIGSDTTICEGAGVLLNGIGNGAITWNSGIPNGAIVKPQSSTTYTAKIVDVNGCENTKDRFVKVNPLPLVQMDAFSVAQVCLDQTSGIELPNAIPLGGIYSGNGLQNGKFYPQLAGTGEHTISYKIEDGNGCKNETSSVIEVMVCTGVNEITTDFIKIYPNPVNNVLHIDLNTDRDVAYEILDLSGKSIQSGVWEGYVSQNISVSEFSAGVYLLKTNVENHIKFIKFIKY
ncbi:T9SS type A sorting domain-containing protein [bacterium SCSIO 12643]|nr:T9SS type A sorting domain-containing protein [bacterium SCSIO 12643]